MRAAAAVALAAALLAGGCGSTTSDGEPVQSAVNAFLEACASRDYPTAIEALTPADRNELIDAGSGLDGCRRILRGLVPPGTPDAAAQRIIARAQPGATDTAGAQATAIVGSGPHSTRIELEYARSSWWIAAPTG